jgi:lipopolysaccharide transport system ATP-binding protein
MTNLKKNQPIIEVKHLSKEYQIGIDRTYKTLSESLMNGIRHPVHTFRNILTMGPKDTFWALKDVNFEVARGEVVGIIGKNGAGKSTLLKILSRITYPTEGEVRLRGRVGSLLEVGTGFHPELTGRENIYFNGAILGMKKKEIDNKFDEIVKFSGVEKYLDTPIKRYSSGMNVRLAFSVAAHLDPEILLVDEVLAVGDAEFQKKCLGKMRDVTSEGRTVLFVSHNMASIEELCPTAMLFEDGNLALSGPASEVIRSYLKHVDATIQEGLIDLAKHPGRYSSGTPIFEQLRLLDQRGQETAVFSVGDTLIIQVILNAGERIWEDAKFAVNVYNERGLRICTLRTEQQVGQLLTISGKLQLQCSWAEIPLAPGQYHVGLSLKINGKKVDIIERAAMFKVVPGNIYGTGKITHGEALIWCKADWKIKHLD